MKTKHGGFTLVEILICIGIIALLSAIVIPVTAKAREKAHQSTCESNLHQWSLAFQVYVSDNDNHYPDEMQAWLRQSAFDVNKVTSCPSFAYDKSADNHSSIEAMGYLRTGYVYNVELGQSTQGENIVITPKGPLPALVTGRPESVIAYPTTTLLLMDGVGVSFIPPFGPNGPNLEGDGSVGSGMFDTMRNKMKDYPEIERAWRRHQGGGNFLFCDGHIKWMTPEAISGAAYNDGVHPGFAPPAKR
jgi:prepilin-type processing-associated H-X9-DG protein/prepilin-type N-terminal cleavage/methylation domain-containing protein